MAHNGAYSSHINRPVMSRSVTDRRGGGRANRNQLLRGLRGDVNKDGRVNNMDVLATSNAAVSLMSKQRINARYGPGAFTRMDSYPGGWDQPWVGDNYINTGDVTATSRIRDYGHYRPGTPRRI